VRRAFVAAVAAGLALPGSAGAAGPEFADRFVAASPANYPRAYRAPSLIRYVVVHTTEGSYGGTILWFRNPRARVSAHYVVGRNGETTQMVPLARAAWHAGNGWMNRVSVGIEHEGFAHVQWTVTDGQYRASARLVAAILRSRVLPIDRRHVIGHDQVPHPWRRGRFGGYSGRTDPGPFWDWARFMRYVRSYARGVVPPPAPFDVATPELAIGSVLADRVGWVALTAGSPATRVDFRVNGNARLTLRQPPFAYGDPGSGWDTTFEPNGRYTLTVRARSADGRVAGSSVVVTIRNPTLPRPVVFSLGLVEEQTVCGAVRWEVQGNRGVRRVEFLVDGVVRDLRAAPPYVFGGEEGLWHTAAEAPGPHVVAIEAAGPRGAAGAQATVVVAPPPCEEPPAE
jgi:hypothetical protein